MITAYHKPAFATFVNTNGERHLLSVAAITANLARVSWINSFKRPASIFSFAFRHLEKASPRWRFLTIMQSKEALVRSPAPAFAIRGGALVHRPRRDRFTTWRK
jgi:hypothetical protein